MGVGIPSQNTALGTQHLSAGLFFLIQLIITYTNRQIVTIQNLHHYSILCLSQKVKMLFVFTYIWYIFPYMMGLLYTFHYSRRSAYSG